MAAVIADFFAEDTGADPNMDCHSFFITVVDTMLYILTVQLDQHRIKFLTKNWKKQTN
jgi:hypothetical protein